MDRPGLVIVAMLHILWIAALAGAAQAAEFPEPLAPEPIPSVAALGTPYPASYALVHDFDGAFLLVDSADARLKGMLSTSEFATVAASGPRQELYVGETYYSHGSRGERADLVSVYDMATLALEAEIAIPNKRAALVAHRSAMAITASGDFLLVFNLTPSTSVSVVDLDRRTFVGEIPTPGCSLVYPTRANEFFMLCGDGALNKVVLDDAGAVVSQTKSAPFIDIDNDPLAEKATFLDGAWQFVSFNGDVQPISAAGEPGERWPLTSEAERAAGWRPTSMWWTAGLPGGRLWVAMTPNGYDGSHKDPLTEVWLFDVNEHKRLARLPVKVPGLSLAVTAEEAPRLMILTVEGTLDVYDAMSGEYQRTIPDLGAAPLQVYRLP
ncbi:MAG: amine dehydrogenase large subunit [Pseudomonadales bacterium]|jgi:methylamine dehydrogenase heavy chain